MRCFLLKLYNDLCDEVKDFGCRVRLCTPFLCEGVMLCPLLKILYTYLPLFRLQRNKLCAHINKYVGKEKKELDLYCGSKGVYYYFNRNDGALDVISKTGKWKIIVQERLTHFVWVGLSILKLEDNLSCNILRIRKLYI